MYHMIYKLAAKLLLFDYYSIEFKIETATVLLESNASSSIRLFTIKKDLL